jgi:MFS family permease
MFVCHLGTAPIMCFMPTVVRQRGYSAVIVGLILTLLLFPDLLIRPIVGFLTDMTDKYKCRKSGLMASLIMRILIVVILFLIPGTTVENEMDDMDVIKSPLFWLFTGTVIAMKIGLMTRYILEDTICIYLLGKNDFHRHCMCK